MRKLIELTQPDLIVCDNTTCDFKIPNKDVTISPDISMYVDVACPKCGENLLTEKDFLDSLRFEKAVKWVNKWFSWLTIFKRKKASDVGGTVHIHNGIHIKEK